jgi:hypothetical protein
MIWGDRERAEALGQAGLAWVSGLSWGDIAGRLIKASAG